ncbi:alanine/glycine:cation symporter family protein [Dialister invisus]|uniref:alanine/glycine:cation symporter family protein n=1 Tax=Dialister invisus TaxID=218538 RepID=UPI00265E1DB3|nr:sodium:alanine symporter family protein [Dialister invisus]
MDMTAMNQIVGDIDSFVWGPVMLCLLVGTGIYLTAYLNFRTWRNLPYAMKSVFSREARKTNRGSGDVSPFSALMTALAATIGTGNIVGVATAMFAGGPGALVWMWVSACFGLTTKFSECMLGFKFREVNAKGEMKGGPMFTMKNGFKNKRAGLFMGFLFAMFTVIASFGIGNMTQANSITTAVSATFGFSNEIIGAALTVLTLAVIVGGITSISRVSSLIVPGMAVFYIAAGLLCIALNFENIPHGLYLIFMMAFDPAAVEGGVVGTITVSVMNSVRFGVARGCFSNEAGLGSAAISAAASTTDDPARQGYVSMTGTFIDTIIVCTITGLTIASSGVLGTIGPDGKPLTGVVLTMAAFSTHLGTAGNWIVSVGIMLFAYSTILGWEYNGEKAWEYLWGTHTYNIIYRLAFSLVVYVGATQTLDLVWNLSDIANALMAVPNLVSMLVLAPVIKEEVLRFEAVIAKEKAGRKEALLEENEETLHI